MSGRSVTTNISTTVTVSAPALVAGVDEVGRGALFGPVVAAVVVVTSADLARLSQLGVKDSKQLSASRRAALVPSIHAIAHGVEVGWASVQEIDQLNIRQASRLAMQRAVIQLTAQPAMVYVDGRDPIPEIDSDQETLIGGDRLSPAIAAASIVAKVYRDNWIVALAQQYPGYDLAASKGYGTQRHREALQRLGATEQHRLSFSPCRVTPSSAD